VSGSCLRRNCERSYPKLGHEDQPVCRQPRTPLEYSASRERLLRCHASSCRPWLAWSEAREEESGSCRRRNCERSYPKLGHEDQPACKQPRTPLECIASRERLPRVSSFRLWLAWSEVKEVESGSCLRRNCERSYPKLGRGDQPVYRQPRTRLEYIFSLERHPRPRVSSSRLWLAWSGAKGGESGSCLRRNCGHSYPRLDREDQPECRRPRIQLASIPNQ
jgi:hypothetical protein